MSIEGQGHFFTIYFPGFVCFLCFTRPIYQVSVYRTIGPLVLFDGIIQTILVEFSMKISEACTGKFVDL